MVLGPTMIKKVEIVHVDLLGNEIHVGNHVAAYYFNGLTVCRVEKLTPKMVKVKPIDKNWSKSIYPHDLVKINDDDVTMYLLRNKK